MFATRLGWEGENSGRGDPKGFRKKEKLLCIAAERIPYKKIRQRCNHAQTQRKSKKGKKALKQPAHLALSHTRRTNSEQRSSTTQLSRHLFLLQRHLQSSSTTPSHQTSLSNKPGSACISLLFRNTLSVSLCPHRIWQVSQHYSFSPPSTLHKLSICCSPSVLCKL